MGVSGRYVNTFAEASHALPEGMSMNADYPFMLPKIVALDDSVVTLEGRCGQLCAANIKRRGNREYCDIAQTSSFEDLFHRKPTVFRFWPFKDEGIGGCG